MRFPVFTLVAPAITSVILWVITRSPLSLIFALMGPVAAVAQFGDSKLFSRREKRRERERQKQETDRSRREHHVNVLRERESQLAQWPRVFAQMVEDDARRPPWVFAASHSSDPVHQVRLGVSHSEGVPVVIDLDHGLVIRGHHILTAAVLRAIHAQLGWHCGTAELDQAELDQAELDRHNVLLCDGSDPLPPQSRFLLDVSPEGSAALTDFCEPVHSAERTTSLEVDLLSRAEFEAFTRALFHLDERIRQSTMTTQSAAEAEPALGLVVPQKPATSGLGVVVGQAGQQLLHIDLLSDGPHAVVTGKTGSGKSEFLCAWMLAMCATYRPERLNIVLFDFKGGTSFTPISQLPHVAGSITDLDRDRVPRAIASLASELRHRERVIQESGVADISMLSADRLPRLVVVVDEYRVLLQQLPSAGEVFADIAARGRSLGVHLVLATQRVAGSVHENLLTNVPLRVAFGQLPDHDAHTLLGDRQPRLASRQPGWATVLRATGALENFRAARVTADARSSAEEVFTMWREQSPYPPVKPIWVPELPPLLTRAEAMRWAAGSPTDSRASFGLCVSAEQQHYEWASYVPDRDGVLLVTGPAQSGKTTALRAMATGVSAPNWILTAEQLWDVVVEKTVVEKNSLEHGSADAPAPAALPAPAPALVIDDCDAMLADYPADYVDRLLHHLPVFMRAHRGRAIVLSCSANSPFRHQLAKLADTQLELSSRAKPGEGSWRNSTVTVFMDGPEVPHSSPEPRSLTDFLSTCTDPVRIYSSQSAQLQSRLLTAGRDVSVCSVEPGLAVSGLTASSDSSRYLVFDRCSPAEVRMLRLYRGLLPYTDDAHVLVVDREGDYFRLLR